MRKDVVSSLFCLIFSIYFSIESYRLGLGEWASPSSGYFPFGAALLFGIISVFVMVKALRQKNSRKIPIESRERWHWKNIVLVLCSMFVYILILNKIGFLGSTFLIVVFLIHVVARWRWNVSVATAILTALGFRVVFGVLLKVFLPTGMFGF